MNFRTALLLPCLNILAAPLALAATNPLAAVPQLVPAYKQMQTLVASTELGDRNYVAFPILLRLNETSMLLGYKRGYAHYRDAGAGFEVMRLNPLTTVVEPGRASLQKPDLTFQNGEFARFPNGDIACYIDVQGRRGGGKTAGAVRTGLIEYRSTDDGRTFQEMGKLGVIDGVEYGYAFEALTEGGATWMLAMTFTNLTGGKPVGAANPASGSVNVIRTDNNGKTWRFVKALTHEFGDHPINESSFVRYRDGFIVAARGYGDSQWLQFTDGEFNLRRQSDLAAKYSCTRSHVGRPRAFARDGGYYLLGRNYTAGADGGADRQQHRGPKVSPMKLSLFRIDPETLAITRHVLLDNAESARLTDGYYAVPYWQEHGRKTYFNVITYKALGGAPPDIVRLEYDWDEVR